MCHSHISATPSPAAAPRARLLDSGVSGAGVALLSKGSSVRESEGLLLNSSAEFGSLLLFLPPTLDVEGAVDSSVDFDDIGLLSLLALVGTRGVDNLTHKSAMTSETLAASLS